MRLGNSNTNDNYVIHKRNMQQRQEWNRIVQKNPTNSIDKDLDDLVLA